MNLFAHSPIAAAAGVSTLAQGGRSTSQAMFQILWLLGLMVLLALVVVLVAMWIRRRLARSQDDAVATGFTLHEMRRLHQEGQLSDEEYEAARAALLARSRHAMGETGATSPPPPAVDPPDPPEKSTGGSPE